MINFVQTNQVTGVNGNEFGVFSPLQVLQIPCESTQIIAAYWRIPQVNGITVVGYTFTVAEDNIKPTDDAAKILRVKMTDTAGVTTVDFAIVDGDNIATSSPPNQFAYLCDGAGGTLPVMPTVTVPAPIIQTPPQIVNTTNDDFTFVFPFPENNAALLYQMNSMYFNGQAATPTYSPSGKTTPALFVTWANSNWGDYGTWSSTGNVVKLLNTTSSVVRVALAGMNIELAPVNFCFSLSAYSTPAVVNQIKFGSGNLIPVPPFYLTDNPNTLLNVLRPRMANGTIFTPNTGAHNLQINTVQALPKLYNDGSLVVASVSGAC